jgi:DeoR/GlpR family transcriptional regulator of sugar metabolism
MITRDKLLELARQNNKISVSPLAVQSGVSKQYLNRLINELVIAGKLIKVGGTRYGLNPCNRTDEIRNTGRINRVN